MMSQVTIETEDLQYFDLKGLEEKELAMIVSRLGEESFSNLLRKLMNAQVLTAAVELVSNAERDFDKNNVKAVKVKAFSDVAEHFLSLADIAKEEIDRRKNKDLPSVNDYPIEGI